MKMNASQKLLTVWTSSGNYVAYSGEETSFQWNVTLDQLANLESGQSQSSANSENTKRTLTTENYIEANLRSYVSDYDYTTIDSITINEDAGTDTPDDYIALVYLTWTLRKPLKRCLICTRKIWPPEYIRILPAFKRSVFSGLFLT